MSDSLSFVVQADHGAVRTLRLEHGKPNSISQGVAEELSSALARAAEEASVKAVVLLGRDGMFSGGFDLPTMGRGAEAARDMVIAGGRLAIDVFNHPKPIVVGCGGHAVAMGCFLVMAGDERIGADGAFKIGMNETAIGMTLPDFGVELARTRLSKRHFDRAVVQSTMYDPKGAVEIGVLDRLVAAGDLEAEAIAAAARLGELKQPAFRNNKQRAHRETVERILGNLEENVASLMR